MNTTSQLLFRILQAKRWEFAPGEIPGQKEQGDWCTGSGLVVSVNPSDNLALSVRGPMHTFCDLLVRPEVGQHVADARRVWVWQIESSSLIWANPCLLRSLQIPDYCVKNLNFSSGEEAARQIADSAMKQLQRHRVGEEKLWLPGSDGHLSEGTFSLSLLPRPAGGWAVLFRELGNSSTPGIEPDIWLQFLAINLEAAIILISDSEGKVIHVRRHPSSLNFGKKELSDVGIFDQPASPSPGKFTPVFRKIYQIADKGHQAHWGMPATHTGAADLSALKITIGSMPVVVLAIRSLRAFEWLEHPERFFVGHPEPSPRTMTLPGSSEGAAQRTDADLPAPSTSAPTPKPPVVVISHRFSRPPCQSESGGNTHRAGEDQNESKFPEIQATSEPDPDSRAKSERETAGPLAPLSGSEKDAFEAIARQLTSTSSFPGRQENGRRAPFSPTQSIQPDWNDPEFGVSGSVPPEGSSPPVDIDLSPLDSLTVEPDSTGVPSEVIRSGEHADGSKSPTAGIRTTKFSNPQSQLPSSIHSDANEASDRFSQTFGEHEIRNSPTPDQTIPPASTAHPESSSPPNRDQDPLIALDLDRNEAALRLLDRLPLPVLVFSEDALFFANGCFLELCNHSSLDDFRVSGGVETFFDSLRQEQSDQDNTVSIPVDGKAPIKARVELSVVRWKQSPASILFVVPLEELIASHTSEIVESEFEPLVLAWQEIVHSLVDGVVWLGGDGCIARASFPVADLFEQPAASLIGLPFTALLHSEDRRWALDYLDRTMRRTQNEPEISGLMVRKRGSHNAPPTIRLILGRSGSGFAEFYALFQQRSRNHDPVGALKGTLKKTQSQLRARSSVLSALAHHVQDIATRPGGIDRTMRDVAGSVLAMCADDNLRNPVPGPVGDLTDRVKTAVDRVGPRANDRCVVLRFSAPDEPILSANAEAHFDRALDAALESLVHMTRRGTTVIVSLSDSAESNVSLRIRATGNWSDIYPKATTKQIQKDVGAKDLPDLAIRVRFLQAVNLFEQLGISVDMLSGEEKTVVLLLTIPYARKNLKVAPLPRVSR